MDLTASWRLFIALELPASLKEDLVRQQTRLRQAIPGRTVRWVRPQTMHLTLRFLGQVAATRRPDLEGALHATAAGHTPLRVRPEGLGSFGGRRRLLVIWVGLSGAEPRLSRLAADLDHHLSRAGFPLEDRPFQGHLTLGRVRETATTAERMAVHAALDPAPVAAAGVFSLAVMTLMRSHLEPGGARHEVVARAPLGVPGEGP